MILKFHNLIDGEFSGAHTDTMTIDMHEKSLAGGQSQLTAPRPHTHACSIVVV